jgi:hypothetical protein
LPRHKWEDIIKSGIREVGFGSSGLAPLFGLLQILPRGYPEKYVYKKSLICEFFKIKTEIFRTFCSYWISYIKKGISSIFNSHRAFSNRFARISVQK